MQADPASNARPLLLSIVIPTRHESATAPLLISELRRILDHTAAEVIFVDDSDDDTPAIIERCASEIGLDASVIHREGEARQGGLSTAVLDGIRAARGLYVLIMDADLQHPPAMIAALLDRAKTRGADIVIASRNIPGGSDAGLAGRSRKVISWGAKWLVKLLFYDRLRGVTDPLSGFFLARRSLVMDAILRPIGFKILLDMLVRCSYSSVEEVPLKFAERAGGRSKATIAQGKDFLSHVITLVWDARVNRQLGRRTPAAREENP